MATPKNIDKIYEDIEKTLDRSLASEMKAIERAVKKTEKEVLEALVRLQTDGGDIKARTSLARAIQYQKRLTRVVAQEYGAAYEQYTKNLTKITDLVQKEYDRLDLGLQFSDVDRDTFASLRIAANAEFAALGEYTLSEITSPLYENVLAGGTFNELASTLEGLLFSGGEGRMAYISRRKVHDTLMGYYQANQLQAAKRTGITDFLYFGNIIKSTRDFCARRAGRIYGVKEIQSWNELKWKGKKPGNVFINRGGYNCRHTLHPVKKRWVKEGRVKVQEEQRRP